MDSKAYKVGSVYKGQTLKRNIGIDILRIISMFLIATSHICTQGGILNTIKPFTVNYILVWLVMCIAYCATNCYALISGYVGIDAEFSYHRLAILWVRVVFYTLLITIVFDFVEPEAVGLLDYVSALTPVTTGWYWYFSAYFALFLIIPFLNLLINKMSEKQFTIFVFSLIVVFSILPTIRHVDAFATNNGYSTLWLIILYIMGAWIKKTQILYRFKKKIWFLIWFSSVLILITSKIIMEYLCLNLFGRVAGGGYLISYISPIVLLETISLCGIFVQIKMKHTKALTRIAGLTFSVYIIHQHPLLKEQFLRGKLLHYARFSPISLVLAILATALTIFVVCLLIDWIRELIFRVLKINLWLEKGTKKLQKKYLIK